ncbi:MAG: hypothetical protein ABEI86_14840, partial [Halobacteriaceae archaeon]
FSPTDVFGCSSHFYSTSNSMFKDTRAQTQALSTILLTGVLVGSLTIGGTFLGLTVLNAEQEAAKTPVLELKVSDQLQDGNTSLDIFHQSGDSLDRSTIRIHIKSANTDQTIFLTNETYFNLSENTGKSFDAGDRATYSRSTAFESSVNITIVYEPTETILYEATVKQGSNTTTSGATEQSEETIRRIGADKPIIDRFELIRTGYYSGKRTFHIDWQTTDPTINTSSGIIPGNLRSVNITLANESGIIGYHTYNGQQQSNETVWQACSVLNHSIRDDSTGEDSINPCSQSENRTDTQVKYDVEYTPKASSGVIKFEKTDNDEDGLGENKALETDVFEVKLDNSQTPIKITTKAGSNSDTIELGPGECGVDSLGFRSKVITHSSGSYMITITSLRNVHALSHVKFDFGDQATFDSPPETTETINRSNEPNNCLTTNYTASITIIDKDGYTLKNKQSFPSDLAVNKSVTVDESENGDDGNGDDSDQDENKGKGNGENKGKGNGENKGND